MPALICLLRGVNVGGHNIIKMDALRALCESLKLREVQTYVQSGNVVFEAPAGDLAALARRIENGIEKGFGCRPDVVLRSLAEMRELVARNPFAGRADVEPNKLLVVFFGAEPDVDRVRGLKVSTEELHLVGRELYVYFPIGQGQSKLSFAPFDRGAGKVSWTGRNWNTVMKLLEMAASVET